MNCPSCDKELKIVGRCGFCKNPDCTVFNVLFRK